MVRPRYKRAEDVPLQALIDRLRALSAAVSDGPAAIAAECTMRVPVEFDRDADVVLHEAARRLEQYGKMEQSLTVEDKVCAYPECVDNGVEGKCYKWLAGDCPGPNGMPK